MRRLRAPHLCDQASVGTRLYTVGLDGTVTAPDEDAVALYAAGFVDEPDAAPEPAPEASEEPAAEAEQPPTE
jgi:hypothetical protein